MSEPDFEVDFVAHGLFKPARVVVELLPVGRDEDYQADVPPHELREAAERTHDAIERGEVAYVVQAPSGWLTLEILRRVPAADRRELPFDVIVSINAPAEAPVRVRYVLADAAEPTSVFSDGTVDLARRARWWEGALPTLRIPAGAGRPKLRLHVAPHRTTQV